MKIEDLKADIEKGDMIYRGFCHDCETPVEVNAKLREDGAIEIKGNGCVYKVKIELDDRYYFKCAGCFAKDRTLHNFRPIETYSRVVGYLRPVKQWNKGKVAEWNIRKEFTNTDGK
jgi:hypothetical protein